MENLQNGVIYDGLVLNFHIVLRVKVELWCCGGIILEILQVGFLSLFFSFLFFFFFFGGLGLLWGGGVGGGGR